LNQFCFAESQVLNNNISQITKKTFVIYTKMFSDIKPNYT